MKKYPVALFDLDGVIIDTEGQYSYFWENVAAHLLPDVENFSQRIKGHTLKEIYNLFFPDVNVRKELTQLVLDYEQNMDYQFIPGADSFIRELKEAKTPMAIVTSSDMFKMNQVYRAQPHLKDLFDFIVTAELIIHSKPAPDCYLLAAKRFEASPQDCVVFEDSKAGLASGAAAGTRLIGLSTTCLADEIEPISHLVIPDFLNFSLRDFTHFYNNQG